MNGTLSDEWEEDELYELSLWELIIWCILYASIAVLAVFGNLLVIFVTLSRLRTRSITTYFIINLAFADLLTGIFAIPFKFQAALFQAWYFPPILCKIVPYAETVTLSVSVFTLSASAIHEFRTVFFPKHGRLSATNASDVLMRKALALAGIEPEVARKDSKFEILETAEVGTRMLVLMIWIVAAIVSLPHGLFHKVYTYTDTDNTTIDQCRPVYAEENWWKVYNIYLTIITYFVPMVILDTAYTLIAIKIWTTTSSMSEELQIVNAQGTQSVEVSNRKVIHLVIYWASLVEVGYIKPTEMVTLPKAFEPLMKMLIIVVAVFSLCWFPLETYLLLNEVKPEINGWYYINLLFFCSHWLAMSNSCLNPIIYGLYNDKYNREYKRVFFQIYSFGKKNDENGETRKFDTEYSAPTIMHRHSTPSNNGNVPYITEHFQIKEDRLSPLARDFSRKCGNPTSTLKVRSKNGYIEVHNSPNS